MEKSADPTVMILVKLPRSLKAALEVYATQHKKNLSQVVRESLASTMTLPVGAAKFTRARIHPSDAARRAHHNEQARRALRLMRALAHSNPEVLEALLEEHSA